MQHCVAGEIPELEFVAAEFDHVLSVMLASRRDFDTERIAASALTWVQHGVLKIIAAGPIRLTALAQMLRQSPPSMSVTIRRMQQHGLVTRAGSADRRVALIEATPRGISALEESQSQMLAETIRRLFELTQDEREQVRRALPVLERLVDTSKRNVRVR